MSFSKILMTAGGLLFFAARGLAQHGDVPESKFIAANIPDSLKKNAHAVVRYSYDEYKLKGPGKAEINHHSVVTILDEKGDHKAQLVLYYNRKYDTYGSITMKIYNAEGKVLKKYYKSDMYDRAAADYETIVTDDRLLAVEHTPAAYPVTVEVSYEEDLSGYLGLDAWHPQGNAETSVENAECRVIANSAVGFRYVNKNTSIQPQKTKDGENDVYSWTMTTVKAMKPEEESLAWQYMPSVRFGVDNFEFYGHTGSFADWQSFGKWLQALNADVCTLPPDRAADIRKMTDTIKSDKDKARFLYQYMQKNMHYISIQLGIGGWKPFDAGFVDQKKYGDCKALSNYMRALLNAVNIPAYYVVINAGYNGEPADFTFPENRFNHAILCIPFKNDTTWLECTSNSTAFGKLGPVTENRRALLVTEEGGRLVNTPKSTMEDNQLNGEVHLVLNADGSGKAEVKILSNGEYRSDFVDELPYYKEAEQKEKLLNRFNIKQPSAFEYKPDKDVNGFKEVRLNLEYDKFYDMAAGDKQFLRPRVIDIWTSTVPVLEKRKTTFYFDHPMQKSCVTTIDLPQGFEIDALPANVNLKFSYGTYESTYKYDAVKNQVIATTKFNLTNQAIPASKYTEMQQYLDEIAKAQNKKMVIRRKAA